MRRATKWLKGLLGMKREKHHVDNTSIVSSNRKEKQRWSFAKSGKDTTTNRPSNVPVPADSAWLISYLTKSENEHIKHAIAVSYSPMTTPPPSPPSFAASRSASVSALTSPPPHQPQLLPP
ncbi:hypothetical protein ACFX1T_043755 [Malus domestica]